MAKKLDQETIKKTVSDFYRGVANDEEGVKIDTKDLGKSLGYSQEELDSVPEEANAGLGCGNPQEKAQPKPGETVLDLGCGKGMDVFIASKKVGDQGHVIGVDAVNEMVEKARYIAKKRGFTNVEFRLGEIEHLPIADNQIDVAISNCVINLSPHKQEVYNDVLRVLKPGGRVSISDVTLKQPLPQSIYDNPRMYGTCVAGAVTLENLREILENAGYVNIEIEAKDVSDAYAQKWGIEEVDLKDYLYSSIVTAEKAIPEELGEN